MKAAGARATTAESELEVPELAPSRTFALGFLAMVPLLVAYEWAALADPDSPRNSVVLLAERALAPAGEHVAHVRWALLGLVAVGCTFLALRRGASIVASVSRILIEGLLAACVLGPLMVVLVRSLPEFLPQLQPGVERAAPGLVETALVFGAAAWEELFFRVGLYSFLYWLTLRFVLSFDASERLARACADVAGLVLSSLAFAAAHFAPVLRFLGPGGRPFDAALFTWLACGGALLGLLFRLRGPGVAAWTHGLFNVALWVGVDPDVIW